MIQSGDSSNASETAWGWYDFYVYIQLKPGVDYQSLEAKLPAFANKYINSQEWILKNNNRSELHLILLPDTQLYSNYNHEAEAEREWQGSGFSFSDCPIHYLYCVD